MKEKLDTRESISMSANENASMPTHEIAAWKPTLFSLLVSGTFAGAILGAADGVLAHYIVETFDSTSMALLCGGSLGIAGGIAVVLFRRIVWGPDISVEIGTVLGLIYGIAPGAALLFNFMLIQNVVIATKGFVGLVMVASMLGLLIGGLLDRITESIIAWKNRRVGQ